MKKKIHLSKAKSKTKNKKTLYPKRSGIGKITSKGGSQRKREYKYGFANTERALTTIKLLRNKKHKIKMAIANTLLQRARFHPNKTTGIRNAIKIFKRYIEINKKKK
jgi:tRNA C32,U32 (ribose-2'-O)-methylase TrmJ